MTEFSGDNLLKSQVVPQAENSFVPHQMDNKSEQVAPDLPVQQLPGVMQVGVAQVVPHGVLVAGMDSAELSANTIQQVVHNLYSDMSTIHGYILAELGVIAQRIDDLSKRVGVLEEQVGVDGRDQIVPEIPMNDFQSTNEGETGLPSEAMQEELSFNQDSQDQEPDSVYETGPPSEAVQEELPIDQDSQDQEPDSVYETFQETSPVVIVEGEAVGTTDPFQLAVMEGLGAYGHSSTHHPC